MDQTTLIIVAIVVVALLVAAIVFMQRRRTDQLQSKFGSEYDRAVKETGGKAKAEAELQKREKRVEKLDIHPLERGQRQRYIDRWQKVQADFVDNPKTAVVTADALLGEVMAARGYPVENFDQVAADISVDHPSVVENFRTAHAITVRHEKGEADTEDLRKAMLHYRKLFDELVTDEPSTSAPTKTAEKAK